MSIKCMYFSSLINFTTPGDASCCVFSSAVGCIHITNFKGTFALYFNLFLNSVSRYDFIYLLLPWFALPSVFKCHQ
jgi:hypothetical protein